MKRKFSIQITILVSFLMVLMLSCGSIIYYNYIKTTESFMEDVESDIQIKTNMILNDTQNYLLPAKITTQFMAWFSQSETNVLDAIDDITMQAMKMLELYPQIAGFFSGDSAGDFVAVRFVGEDATYPYGEKLPLPKNARYEVRIINRHSGLVTEFHKYLDKNGRVVALQERPRATEYFDPRHRPWYRGAEDTKKPYWSDPYIFLLSQKVGVTAATPVVNEEGKVKIVISADITMDAISDLLTQHKIGKTGFAFIFNPQGEIVGYPNIHKLGNSIKTSLPTFKDTKNPILIDAFKYYQKTKKMRFLISNEGMDYLIRFKEFGEKFEKTWLIGFIVPKKELTGPIDDITKLMMIFSLIVFLLSGLLIYIISKNIARPITRAADAMSAIARFEIDESDIQSSYFSEIQKMNRALMHMKQSLRDFSRFVPKAVVTKLIESGSGAKIGGRKRNITLMFTDIENFTTISEKMSSEKLIVHLSDYLNQLTHIIQENNGTIDKYIGDAIMTFWGAPVDDPKHPLLACKAALACKKRLEELNKTWELDGKPPLYTRFGIHTGDAIVGNVGSEDRLNYSAFGDSVNLGARLEGINKYYHTEIIISHETYKNVRHKFICRPLDMVAVKGKNIAVAIYELLYEVSEDQNKKLDMEVAQEFARMTKEAFALYLEKDWDGAIKKYTELKKKYPKDYMPDLFIDRCKAFKASPPDDSWQGVAVMTEK
ncbi:MAG: hypothetical protein GW748_07040 [Alphaproteobacteria bacterium]|nr:hypothetical protein [Alphaproteobacteria bacterium]